jgi:hypothetical protein
MCIIPGTWKAAKEDHSLRPIKIKKKSDQDTISKDKSGKLAHICNPRYTGDRGRRIIVQGWPG